jgi:hypothetical protein
MIIPITREDKRMVGPGTALVAAFNEITENYNEKRAFKLFKKACNNEAGMHRLMSGVADACLKIKAGDDIDLDDEGMGDDDLGMDDGDMDMGGMDDDLDTGDMDLDDDMGDMDDGLDDGLDDDDLGGGMESSYYDSKPRLLRMNSKQVYERCVAKYGRAKVHNVLLKAGGNRARTAMYAAESGKFKEFFKGVGKFLDPRSAVRSIKDAIKNTMMEKMTDGQYGPGKLIVDATTTKRLKQAVGGGGKLALLLMLIGGLGLGVYKAGKVIWNKRKLKSEAGIDMDELQDKAAKETGMTGSYFDNDDDYGITGSSSIDRLLGQY